MATNAAPVFRGQDPAQWLPGVLGPQLWQGEQILAIALGFADNFPFGRPTQWLFDAITTATGEKLETRDQTAFLVLTSHRLFVLPGRSSVDKNVGQMNRIYGIIAIPWAAVQEIHTPKAGQKHGINLIVANPNMPETTAYKVWCWHKEDGVPSQADWIARRADIAKAGVAAARAANAPVPQLFFQQLAAGYLSDRPDLDAVYAAKRASAAVADANGPSRGLLVVAIGLAIPALWLLNRGVDIGKPIPILLGGGIALVAIGLARKGLRRLRATK